jgi:surface antigen
LRGTRRLLPAVLAVVIGVVAVPVSSPVRADTVQQLLAERAQLLQQLAALTPARQAASSALAAAETAYANETAALTQARSQLATLNAKLVALASAITADQNQEVAAKNELATLARATYESANDNSMISAVLNAQDFSAAMNSLSGTSTVTGQIESLAATLVHAQTDLISKRRSVQTDFSRASALENQVSDEDNQLMVTVYQRDQVVDQLSGPARQIAAEIAQIDDELAAAGSSGPSSHGSCTNTFAFGECTWYVATKRCIPWGGNADAWYYNAARMGYKEGHTPQPGAVAVWWPGRGGASWVGHVAYVETVGPAGGIPAGSFEVSEMNWTYGWDHVDYRVVQNDPSVFQGFIY